MLLAIDGGCCSFEPRRVNTIVGEGGMLNEGREGYVLVHSSGERIEESGMSDCNSLLSCLRIDR